MSPQELAALCANCDRMVRSFEETGQRDARLILSEEQYAAAVKSTTGQFSRFRFNGDRQLMFEGHLVMKRKGRRRR